MLRVYGCLTGQHDLRLVVLAATICVLACFTAVSLLVRAGDGRRRRGLAWLWAAATVFGAGVWATHFVAELAYRPGVPVGYDSGLTALSIAMAIVPAWLGFVVAGRYRSLALGGGIVGAAVAAMHYTGMAALRAPARLEWDVGYVAVSVLVGILVAAAALQLLAVGTGLRHRAAAALMLVLAICGLHFTGMAAVALVPDPTIAVPPQLVAPTMLIVVISAITILIIALGLLGALVDQHLAAKAIGEAERLRRSQDHLARAQRITHTGSIERNLRTGELDWSEESYRIFGLDPSQPVPRAGAFVDLFHPDDRGPYRAVRAAADDGRQTTSLRCRIQRSDGEVRWVDHESSVVLGEDGRPARWIGTFTDVTEAHELQAALSVAKEAAETATRAVQAANEDLERRVAERTAELVAMQAELLKKERLSVLGQLTATVAHELRNPLSAIKNTVFTINEIAVANGIQMDRPIARLERSIGRCNQIISDLLEYSRVRRLHCEKRALDPWLAEVVSEQHPPEGVVIEQDLRTGAARVDLDPDRFRRVVINLLDNAAQALSVPGSASAEKRIVLRTYETAGGVELVVEDTGPGIARENLDKVFEPLFSTKSFGTGLGLPTVKQIVEQHGGTVEIESVPGSGTRVIVRLPRAVEELAA